MVVIKKKTRNTKKLETDDQKYERVKEVSRNGLTRK
jgi:hypothetical protein